MRWCRRRGPVAGAVALVLVLVVDGSAAVPARAARPAPAPTPPPAPTLVVGAATLTRCAASPLAYCGTLAVPLDRADPGSPMIDVGYRWYPARAPVGGGAAGTVLPVEGGPGYPSIGSVVGGYTTMYGPLLSDWNLLAVDLRGTGDSTPLDCRALQQFTGRLSGPGFAATAGACGRALDHRWRDASGRWIHASDLFTSAQAAADVAAVVTELDLPPVDLYGDSYGSYFAQVLADRYPALIRSVVLDSTYSTVTIDPWYRSSHDSMPADFDEACLRSPACGAAEPESPWARIGSLAARLRRDPVTGVVPDATGHDATVTMDVVGLVDLVNDAAGDPLVYRSLDAAARALLEDDDPAPLLRLYAQRLALDEEYTGIPAGEYSGELYLAVSCLDYPQLFPMSATPAIRTARLAAAVSGLPAATFAPFSTDEWLQQDQNTEAYTACLDWPTPTVAVPPTTGRLPLLPERLPVLVLGGEFDTWTPPVDVPGIMAQVGGDSRFVEFANATHVVGEGDQPCASTVIQEFVRDPAHLHSLDVSCAAEVPPIRSVGNFAGSLGAVTPVVATAGNTAGPEDLRLAAAAVATAGDAEARLEAIGAIADVGLHGGTIRPADHGSRLALHGDELVPGVAVSGTVVLGSGTDSARLVVTVAGTTALSVDAVWPASGPGDTAKVTGGAGELVLAGTTAAP